MKKIISIVVGIVLSFVCLEFFLQTTSFVISSIVKYRNYKVTKNKFNNDDVITILCAGESTTYEQWPVQLEQYLNNNSDRKFNIITSALPSITIESLLDRTFKMIEDYKPNIVISMMGVNDSNFEKQKESIYRKHKLKTLNLFYLINKHLQNKIYAEEQKYNDLYFLELVDKYKNNTEPPVEFLKILEQYPNNEYALIELIYLYHERHDIENIKKYINMFLTKYPDNIDNKVFVTAISNYCFFDVNNYEELNNILIHLIKNKEKTDSKNINEIFKISLNYRNIELGELEYIYSLLTDNKINSTIVVDIYNYLLQNNINVEYPNYNITFSKEPNFDTEQIRNSYLQLADFLEKNDIVYICMGYPTINIDVFKNMFQDTDLKEKIVFVSNEQNFKNYLKNNEFSSIFTDQFAGSFGHCNDLGNTMIAKNVGDVILDITDKK